jgi:hypothetical protein
MASTRAEEAHVNPYYFSQRYREQLAEFERLAEIRRQMPKPPSPWPGRLSSVLALVRRNGPVVAAEARPCH